MTARPRVGGQPEPPLPGLSEARAALCPGPPGCPVPRSLAKNPGWVYFAKPESGGRAGRRGSTPQPSTAWFREVTSGRRQRRTSRNQGCAAGMVAGALSPGSRGPVSRSQPEALTGVYFAKPESGGRAGRRGSTPQPSTARFREVTSGRRQRRTSRNQGCAAGMVAGALSPGCRGPVSRSQPEALTGVYFAKPESGGGDAGPACTRAAQGPGFAKSVSGERSIPGIAACPHTRAAQGPGFAKSTRESTGRVSPPAATRVPCRRPMLGGPGSRMPPVIAPSLFRRRPGVRSGAG